MVTSERIGRYFFPLGFFGIGDPTGCGSAVPAVPQAVMHQSSGKLFTSEFEARGEEPEKFQRTLSPPPPLRALFDHWQVLSFRDGL